MRLGFVEGAIERDQVSESLAPLDRVYRPMMGIGTFQHETLPHLDVFQPDFPWKLDVAAAKAAIVVDVAQRREVEGSFCTRAISTGKGKAPELGAIGGNEHESR
ncbi:hypothetical protein D9M68_845190 [compost metagenome]